MAHLSYSFCMSMLHSLWQAGLLVIVYFFSEKILNNKISSLQKRNWLFILLLTQVTFFLFTFFIYYFNSEGTSNDNLIGKTVTGILSNENIIIITPWLFTIYLTVINYKMVRALYEWQHFKKLYYTGLQKPSIDLKLFTALKANHFGIKRKVKLWLSNSIKVPVTFGFLNPIIILPVALINLISMQQAETIILHELTHIKANDYLLNWFLIVAENIFFFNPFISSICKKIRLEREKYCDSNVIAFQYSPLLYAETLLQVQYIQQYIPQYQLAAVTEKKQLLQRIQFFSNEKNFTNQKSNRITIPLFSILLFLFLSATIYFQYQITTAKKAVVVTGTFPTYKSSGEINFPAVVTNIFESFSDDKLQNIVAEVVKQQPLIEKRLKDLKPLIQAIQDKVQAARAKEAGAIEEQVETNYITPASIKENDATRQIVIKEEQSGSKNTTVKVYTVAFINDEWVLIPEWMVAAREINTDSLNTKLDTSLFKKDKQEEE